MIFRDLRNIICLCARAPVIGFFPETGRLTNAGSTVDCYKADKTCARRWQGNRGRIDSQNIRKNWLQTALRKITEKRDPNNFRLRASRVYRATAKKWEQPTPAHACTVRSLLRDRIRAIPSKNNGKTGRHGLHIRCCSATHLYFLCSRKSLPAQFFLDKQTHNFLQRREDVPR